MKQFVLRFGFFLALFSVWAAMPLQADSGQDVNASLNRMDRRIQRLEMSVDKLNEENEKTKSIYYVDTIQSNVLIQPSQYSEGPYTLANNFEVISYLSMTNGYGQRAAFITVQNNGSATRVLKDYFIATFGDNSRAIALEISSEEKIAAGEKHRFIAYFGPSNYPIIHVGTN